MTRVLDERFLLNRQTILRVAVDHTRCILGNAVVRRDEGFRRDEKMIRTASFLRFHSFPQLRTSTYNDARN